MLINLIIITIFALIVFMAVKTYKIEQPIEIKQIMGQRDAFERERIAEPFTLADYKHLYGDNIDFNNQITGSGASIVALENKAAVRLSVSGNQTGTAIHQSKKYHHYMPGKSQLILGSFVFYNPTANVYKKIGYFDDDNGIYFQQDPSGKLTFNIRSNTSGSATVIESVERKNWNNDTFDHLDITKTQLLFFDFQWLGVGRVRCGFISGDKFVLCHTFYHSNNLDTVFMSNPNLPIRCEISNTNSPSSAHFDQICSTVISEGGYKESGRDWSWGTSIPNPISSGVEESIMAIRLSNRFKDYHNRMTVRLGNISLLTTDENVFYKVLRVVDGDSLGTSWHYVDEDNSGVQYNTNISTAPSIGSSVYQIKAGYVVGGDKHGPGGGIATNNPVTAKQNYIVQNYDSSNSEAYLITAKNLGTDITDVFVSMDWREIY